MVKMNDALDEIKNLKELDFPEGLHGRIMRRVIFLRFRTTFIIITIFLGLNIFISGWRIWIMLHRLDTLAVISAALDGFELSLSYLSDFTRTALEAAPLWSLSIFLINIFLVAYVFFISSQFKKMEISKGRAQLT